MKLAIWLLVFWMALGANAQPLEFPSSLPLGSEEKLHAWVRPLLHKTFATLWVDTDPDPVATWWDYPNVPIPDPGMPHNPNTPLLDQYRFLFQFLEKEVVKLDPSFTYAIEYGSWFKLPGTTIQSTAYFGDCGEFRLVESSDGTLSIPRSNTNLAIRFSSRIAMPLFPGLTTVLVTVTNSTEILTYDARDTQFNIGLFDESESLRTFYYSSKLATSGLPGTVTVVCYDGMITFTFDHSNGKLISKEIAIPKLEIQPNHDPEGKSKVNLLITSAPGTTVEIECSSDLKTWESLVTIPVEYYGTTVFVPEPSTNAVYIYRVKLAQNN